MEECFLDAEEVEGSIPSAPTIKGVVIQEVVLKSINVMPTRLNAYKY